MNKNRFTILTALLLLAVSFLNAQQQTYSLVKYRPYHIPENAQYLSGKIIFKVKQEYRTSCKNFDISLPEVQQKLNTLKGSGLKKLFPFSEIPSIETDLSGRQLVDLSTLYVLDFQAGVSVEEAVNYLIASEAIEYAEPWYLHENFYIPNDPLSDTTGFSKGAWHHEQIQALEAWDIQKGDSSVLIAVVDAGYKLTHPDLQENLKINTQDPIDGLDNDQDGYIDNYYGGWDLGGDYLGSAGDFDPSVGNVHGHWVLGVLGATADNNLGTTGTAFNCSFLPIKAAPDDSLKTIFFGYQGIVYAADHGADIINASWGGPVRSRFGQDVVRYATINKSAAVIAAAGNTGLNQVFYPAGYEEVISVAGTYFGDTVCCNFQNTNGNSTFHHSVNISAPGWQIRSPFGSESYWAWNGTSAAAPVVAAVAGITKAKFPNLTGFQAAQRVRVTADDIIYAVNPQRTDYLGTGRVNMLRAITDSLRPSVRQINFSAENINGGLTHYAGDTIVLTIDFINYLHASDDLHIKLISQSTGISFLNKDFPVGSVGMMERFSSEKTFVLKLSEFVPLNFNLELKIVYSDPNTGYKDYEFINLRVNPSWINIEDNRFHTSINSNGNFGFNDFLQQAEGLGVQYNFKTNSLYEGGFLIGNSSSAVSDRIRNIGSRDNDFKIQNKIIPTPDDQRTPFTYQATFDDSVASVPLGVTITRNVFVSREPEYDDFIILQYIIQNNNQQPLQNLYAGLFADWDINPRANPMTGQLQTKNASNYSLPDKLAYSWDKSSGNKDYFGVSVLSEHTFRSFVTTLFAPSFSFNSQGKFQALSNIPGLSTATAGLGNEGEDVMQFTSAGPFSVSAGGTDTVAFALLGGSDLADLQQFSASANNLYYCVIEGKGPVQPFSLSDSIVATGQSLQFSDNNSHANSWVWNFGDGTTSNQSSPSHFYNQPGNYTVSLTVSDGQCTFTSSQEVSVNVNVGFDDLAREGNLRIFPNPGKGLIHFIFEGEVNGNYQIEIRDIHGRIIQEVSGVKNTSALETEISITSSPPGIYILKFSHNQQEFTRKIIRQ